MSQRRIASIAAAVTFLIVLALIFAPAFRAILALVFAASLAGGLVFVLVYEFAALWAEDE